MKLLFKIFGVLLIVIIAALVAIPFFLESNVEKIVRQTAKGQVNAKVDFSKINLSLIKNFPSASVTINDLMIVNNAPFENDTLINAKQIVSVLSFSQLFKGFDKGIAIDKIIVDQADINVLVNKDGKANYDIAKPSETTEVTTTETPSENDFKLNLNYEIKDSNIKYFDGENKLALENLSHSGKGDVSAVITDLVTETTLDFSYELNKVKYATKMPIFLDATFELDQKTSNYKLKENNALINHIPLAFSGFIKLLENEDIDIELDFKTKDASFKNLLSAVPNAYKKDINGAFVDGTFDLHGSVKGIFNNTRIPLLDVSLSTMNSSFKYPDLPKGINNITIKSTVTNKSGNPDATRIDLDKFTMKIDEDEFSAEGHFTNLTKNLAGSINTKGTINLENLNKAYPVDLDADLKGIIKANLKAKFTLNDIEKEAYDRIEREGDVTLTKFNFASAELPNPVSINTAEIDFKKNNVTLKSLQLKTGNSDISATGSIKNIIPFVFADKVLKGNFNLNSNSFKVSDFLTSSESSDTSTDKNNEQDSSNTEKLIPSFLDITTVFYAKEVFYDNLKLNNTTGKLNIKDQKAVLKDVTTDIFGGTIAFDGVLDSNALNPTFDMNLNMQKLSIVQSFTNFEMFKKLTPIASALEGLFSSKLSLKGMLNNDLSPNLNSLRGTALANLIDAEMNPSKNKLINTLNQKTDFINLNKINLKDVTANLNFEDGKIKIKPFSFNINNDISVTASGGHAFDGAMDYVLSTNIPAKYLGSSASSLLASLSAQEQENIKVPLPISLGGTSTSPKVGLDMKNAISGLTKQIVATQKNKAKEKVTSEIKKQVNKQLKGKAKNVIGNLLGNSNTKQDAPTEDNTTSEKKKTEDVVKQKAGKLLKGLFNSK